MPTHQIGSVSFSLGLTRSKCSTCRTTRQPLALAGVWLLSAMTGVSTEVRGVQSVTLSVGGVRAEYADTVTGSAISLGSSVEWSGGPWSANFDASFSQFTSGEWVAQLSAAGAGTWRVGPRAGVGFVAFGSVNYLETADWSGTAAAGPLAALVLGGEGTLATLRAAIGQVRRVDETADPLVNAQVGLAAPVRFGRLRAAVTGTASDTTAFADFTAGADVDVGPRVRVDGLVGVRAGDLADSPWWQATIEYGLGPVGILQVGLGTFPSDLSGFTDGFFVQAAVRVAFGAPPASGPVLNRRYRGPRLERVTTGRVRVTVTAREATRVEIGGDWNAWTPTTMRRVGRDAWSADLPLAAGTYHFAIRLDGARWVVPTGFPAVPDDFGGETGILVIPP